jgi:hypothetical protein
MKNEFIPYEQALELKELGFDEECFGYYDIDNGYAIGYAFCYSNVKSQLESGCSAPLYQQAFRWFREKQGYHIDLFVDDDKTFGFCITYFTYTARVDKPIQRQFNTYEEAELACLKKLIEIVNTKEK